MVDKFTIEQVKEAIKKNGGFVTRVAAALNCDTRTIYNYYERYPELKEYKEEIQEAFIDLAENKLVENVKNNDNTAIIFLLKCKGKQRGYIDKQVIDVTSNGQNINNITLNLNERLETDTELRKIVADLQFKLLGDSSDPCTSS